MLVNIIKEKSKLQTEIISDHNFKDVFETSDNTRSDRFANPIKQSSRSN